MAAYVRQCLHVLHGPAFVPHKTPQSIYMYVKLNHWKRSTCSTVIQHSTMDKLWKKRWTSSKHKALLFFFTNSFVTLHYWRYWIEGEPSVSLPVPVQNQMMIVNLMNQLMWLYIFSPKLAFVSLFCVRVIMVPRFGICVLLFQGCSR